MRHALAGIINPVRYNDSVRLILFMVVIMAAACTPVPVTVTSPAAALHAYSTITPSVTPDVLAGLVVSAETPLPSPTPAQYAIRAGDTLSQIAERFRITLDALLAANPGVDPNALRVGEPLLIPASPADGAAQPSPTPVPFPVTQIACHPTTDGGVWCFVLVDNDTPETLENVTARVTLTDASGSAIDSRTALMPLDILAPGSSLPLSVFFPPPLPLDVQPRVEILTAIAILAGDQRYLPAQIQNTATHVSWSGRSAQAHGDVLLPDDSPSASVIWVAAVAYDASGNVVGWRRWESAAGVAAGSSLSFDLLVSSVAGAIDRVDFEVEARP